MGAFSVSYAETAETSTWRTIPRSRVGVGGGAIAPHQPVIVNISNVSHNNVYRFMAPVVTTAPGIALGTNTPGTFITGMRRSREFLDAFVSAVSLATEMAAADEADPPSMEIWQNAWDALAVSQTKLPAPLLAPLQLGGLSAEWHERGMNIEVRFRGAENAFVVIQDARKEVPEFLGPDPKLIRARGALEKLSARPF